MIGRPEPSNSPVPDVVPSRGATNAAAPLPEPMRVRENLPAAIAEAGQARGFTPLKGTAHALDGRNVPGGIQRLVQDAETVLRPEGQGFQELRGARRDSVPSVAGELPEVPGRRGAETGKDRLIWLGRIDIQGSYEPGNVAWVKHQRQISHRRYCHRIPCGDQILTISEAERALGLPKEVLRNRLFQYRMPLERALVRGRIRYRKDSPLVTFSGETLSVPEWSKRLGVKLSTLRERLRSRLPLERALHPGNLRQKGLRVGVSIP